MISFVESPWPALMLGFVAEAILAIVLVRTGRARLVWAMASVAVVSLGLVAIERLVVTETEEVEATLEQVARALVANDPPAVVALFAADSPRRGQVQSMLSRVTVRDARIGGDLEIRLNKLTIPPSASAYFTGRVDVHDNRGTIPYEHVIRKFKVTLHRQGDRWQLYDYADSDQGAASKSGRY